jgi:tetratricopeptide (TPR) repeat protein
LLTTPSFDNNDTSEIKALVMDIQTKAKQTSQGHDTPAYYTHGLIALSLFQHGYPFLSQQLSLTILKDNPNYILPKQILAYTHMILHQRSQAQSYFTQLINNDSKNIHNYQFFAGVCSYRLGEYTDTILYLNQISTDHIISDVIRYKILAYIALKDDTNAAKQMKYLLGQPDIQNTDMILAWENIVFIPYMYGKSYTILEKEPVILDLYIDRCQKESFDTTICQIGKLAKDIQSKKSTYSDKSLNSIIESFPRSYIYYIL